MPLYSTCTRALNFENVCQFKTGLDAAIGLPATNILQAMCREHECAALFVTHNYDLKTSARLEWEFVVAPVPGKVHRHIRKSTLCRDFVPETYQSTDFSEFLASLGLSGRR